MQDFSHQLKEDRKIDFIEQFNEKLLVKQESTNLQVRGLFDTPICCRLQVSATADWPMVSLMPQLVVLQWRVDRRGILSSFGMGHRCWM